MEAAVENHLFFYFITSIVEPSYIYVQVFARLLSGAIEVYESEFSFDIEELAVELGHEVPPVKLTYLVYSLSVRDFKNSFKQGSILWA